MRRLLKLFKVLSSYFPTPLPVGLPQFETWADDIIELSGKFADLNSMKFALASQLIHSKHDKSSIPKVVFVRMLRKAAANQVASAVFQEIKQQQDAKIAEATADKAGAVSLDEKTKDV